MQRDPGSEPLGDKAKLRLQTASGPEGSVARALDIWATKVNGENPHIAGAGSFIGEDSIVEEFRQQASRKETEQDQNCKSFRDGKVPVARALRIWTTKVIVETQHVAGAGSLINDYGASARLGSEPAVRRRRKIAKASEPWGAGGKGTANLGGEGVDETHHVAEAGRFT